MSREMKDSGVEWVGKIPNKWNVGKLKYFYNFTKGNNAAKYTNEYVQEKGKYPVYSGQTKKDGVMGYTDTFEYDMKEALFSTTVGANVMTLKRLTGRFSLSQNCVLIIKKDDNKNVNSSYYYYYLQSLFEYEKNNIPLYMQPSLRIEDLNTYRVLLPSYDEQTKTAKFLDEKTSEIDNIVDKTKQSIEELKAYKQSLITETVTKGLDPDVPMKDSGIKLLGNIPENWKISKLKYFGAFQNGLSKGGNYFGSGFPFVGYSDVSKNFKLPEKVIGLVQSTETEREKYSVLEGDVFFTRTSETIDEVGFSSICMKSIQDATFSGFVIRFRPKISISLVPLYLKYYFRSSSHRDYFAKEMNIVTRASLSQSLLGNLPLLIPPIEEAQKIGKYLEDRTHQIDNLISKKEKMIKELDSYKQSLIYEYVTGKKEVE